jgi:thioredoxin-like negative regulator of GroEL
MKKNLVAVGIQYDELNVDVKENWAIAGLYRVKSLPTLVVTKGGKPEESFVGVRPVRELAQIVGRYGR